MFRLLGLLGGLSLGTDLGTGAPLDESLRRCALATRLAHALGCPDEQVRDVLYVSLLQHLGCTAYAHEGARVWVDDVAFVRLAFLTDFRDRGDVWRTWVGGLAERTGRSRVRVAATALTTGRRGEREGPVATCEVARDAARQLGLPGTVQEALFHGLSEWDGRGYPPAAGEAIPLAARVLHAASTAVLVASRVGPEQAAAALRDRAGGTLDPAVANELARHLAGWLAEEGDPYDVVLDLEPDPVALVDDARLEEVAETFGRLADLKSPWFLGHSAAVARLAGGAAEALRLGPGAAGRLRVAGHLHDLGRVGVPASVWDSATPTRSQLEQARLHAHHSERILSRVPALADVARLAGRHHERLDGSGYHRGLGAAQLSTEQRLLQAADAWRDVVEDRPGRPGLAPEQAAARLESEARAGRLDSDAVLAVLHAAGRPGRARVQTAGLTSRQVAVLRLLAGGHSNREIAEQLSISRRTAEHHVQDVYARTGCTSRAGAALFAMEHGLLGQDG